MEIKLGQAVHLPVSMIGTDSILDGTIIYINHEHRFFMAIFPVKGGVLRECYKF